MGGKNDKEIIRLLIIRWNDNLKKKKRKSRFRKKTP